MRKNKPYHEFSRLSRFRKSIKRRRKLESHRSGFFRYYFNVIHTAKRKGKKLKKNELPYYEKYRISKQNRIPHPEFSDNIKFLSENKNVFSKKSGKLPDNGVFAIPNPFSLTENYDNSFLFLKQLFFALYYDRFEKITLDFKHCTRLDIEASVCMDTLLAEFISYHKKCNRCGYPKKLNQIVPINYNKEAEKILYSIGGYRNLTGLKREYEDIIPFPLCIGDNYSKQLGSDKEIEVTKIVDYIITCLSRTNRTLTWQAEDDLSKVIGEILINAAEHCGRKFRYSIGYFQEIENDANKVGVFNLAIFDFGKTMYQNFKSPEMESSDVVVRMKELSAKYTAKQWFSEREFEEETLWTLYALQEGVTSVSQRKRGNGSIHFIESFFQLKGDMEHDNSSCLTLLSGNTRIKFDGKYQIKKIPRGKDGKLYKMMTFNDSGDIEQPPDKKYVTFAENFFPGTLIVAKIFIKFNNIETEATHVYG